MSALSLNLRSAFRSLRRSPGATLVSMGVLALGIGAATALFSLYNALVLRPLPIPGGERIASAAIYAPDGRGFLGGFGLDGYRELRGLRGPIAGIFLEESLSVRVQAEGLNTSTEALLTTPDYFQVLGVPLRFGVGYGEDRPGVVVSPGFWRQTFGGRTNLDGCRVAINGAWLPVLGVAPEGFRGTQISTPVRLWVSAEAARSWNEAEYQALRARGASGLQPYVRLAPGATPAQAAATLQAGMGDWVLENFKGAPVVKLDFLSQERRKGWDAFMPLGRVAWLALGLLLLLACLNVAQLQAARAYEQRREEATRLALGGRPAQLLGRPVAELLFLVGGGALLALPVAWGLARALSRLTPPSMGAYELDVPLDFRVLGFALGLLLLMGLALTGAAAWRILRRTPMEGLRDGTGGLGRFALVHRGLLGLQLALALALLWSAASVLNGLQRTLTRPLGFDPHGVTVVSFQVPDGTPKAERFAKLAQLRERVVALPGIESAALSVSSPLDPLTLRFIFALDEGKQLAFQANLVSRDYFKTLRIPLLEGREFTDADKDGAPKVVILNRAQAKALFPGGGSIVGRHIPPGGKGMEIVGVVEDHVQTDLEIQPRGFIPLEQVGMNWQCVVVRSRMPRSRLLPMLDRVISDVDPRWPLLQSEPMEEKLLRQQQPQRMASAILGGLGMLAGVLAFSGIFGLQSHLTAQRTREAGLRMALGATPSSVAATFTRSVLLPAAVGLTGGGALVLVGRRLLERLLGNLGAVEMTNLLVAAAALLATALAAAWIPAIRAARTQPSQALRSE